MASLFWPTLWMRPSATAVVWSVWSCRCSTSMAMDSSTVLSCVPRWPSSAPVRHVSRSPTPRCCYAPPTRTATDRSTTKVSKEAVVFRVLNEEKNSSRYSITERAVPELILVLGSQPAGGVSHKPGGRLPLLSARPLRGLLPISEAQWV